MSNVEVDTPRSIDAQVDAVLAEHYGPEDSGDSGASWDSGPEVEQTAAQPEVVNEEQPAAVSGDSFTGINPQELPDDLQPIYKSLQGDYTRKMQELAETRNQYGMIEQFGGPQVAAQAVEFVNRLQTDPEYAAQIHTALSENLQAQGYDVGTADATALGQMQEFMGGDEWDEGDYEDDSYMQPGVDPELQSRLDKIEARFAQMDEQGQILSQAQEIHAQEVAILENNPQWNNQYDLDVIYDLARSTDGNLIQAAQKYEQLQAKTLSDWLMAKGRITLPNEPAPTGGATIPAEGFTSLDDPDLDAAVDRRIREMEAL